MTTVAMIGGIVIEYVWPSPDWRFCFNLGLLGLCLLIFSLYEKGRRLGQSDIVSMEIRQNVEKDAKDEKAKQDADHESHKHAMKKIYDDWKNDGRKPRKPFRGPR